MLDDALKIKQKIFSSDFSFEEIAFSVFKFQYKYNKIYHQFVDFSCKHINQIQSIKQIPFLPIQFFKTHQVYTAPQLPNAFFESSGTTQIIQSKHYIYDINLYEKSFLNGFAHFFGNPKDYNIIALLPNYLERQSSSLVYMFQKLIQLSDSNCSGFFLHNFDELNQVLAASKSNNKKTILLGVTFALLDFAEKFPQDLSHCIIMETGGMKGKRKEMTSVEVHQILKTAFNVNHIYAEYGMTELLSQAYAKDGKYRCGNTLKLLLRDIYNPKEILPFNKRGAINIIDVCNLYSCSFIATDDIGILNNESEFEILGRLDNSDIRGCNLML